MTGWGDELVTAPAAGEPGDGQPQLFYAWLDEFVREQLASMYRRALDGTQRIWCPEWWRHAEAISRLEAPKRDMAVVSLAPGDTARGEQRNEKSR